ncbi:hypothetical protein ACET3Z_028219 [Daucus carota]
MSTRANVYIHHHGDLDITKPSYHGGKVDTINLDTDEFSFRDLEDFSKEFEYDPIALVLFYYKTNGHDFSDGMKILYDDESAREVVNVSMPYGKIDLYIDHCFDFASPFIETEIFNNGGSDGDNEPEYYSVTESSEDECSDHVVSDEELNECRQSQKLFKERLASSNKYEDLIPELEWALCEDRVDVDGKFEQVPRRKQ